MNTDARERRHGVDAEPGPVASDDEEPNDDPTEWEVMLDAQGKLLRFKKDPKQTLATQWKDDDGSRGAPQGPEKAGS
jgi:hypothetical protein